MAAADLLIDVDNLTRRFPRCEALGGLSFQVRRGEITGLLGPNGSGKTTTLRILSCYLAPSSGRVKVAGFDVTTRSLEARRRTGYLPESVPLYLEMCVAEYLAYRGRLKGLRGPRLAARIRAVTDQCGLGDDARRVMATLSRGFRQRIGLADSLLNEPDVLLLDEPLAALDPAQGQAITALLRELGRERAVLFSTHALTEAEQLCDRVLILNNGRLAAADSPVRLVQTATRLQAEIHAPREQVVVAMVGLPEAEDLKFENLSDGWIAVSMRTGGADLREQVAALAQTRQWPVRELRMLSRGFAETYLRLTSSPPRIQNPARRPPA